MFENIIGQGPATDRLKTEITAGTLPASLLLYGPPYSGKMSATLEIARALTCERGAAEWNCGCRSCESQRILAHPDTVFLGSRYFATEIAASADVLARTRKTAAQFLYARAVRKLLHRFDLLLWEGSESKRNGVQSHLDEVEERLSDLMPGSPLPEAPKLSKALQAIGERCGKLAAAVTENIPINQIRNVIFWAHTTGQSRAKVLIVESAERMLDSSRNALLKVLEEPPRGVYLLLTTTRRGAIIPTIQSRLRPYHFPERSGEESREVLSKIFREENPEYHSLRDYFLAWNDTDVEYLRRETERFLDGVLKRESRGRPNEELIGFLSDARVFRPFLEELATACGRLLRGNESAESPLEVTTLEQFSVRIRECLLQSEQYNQSKSLLLESLYYGMRKAVRSA